MRSPFSDSLFVLHYSSGIAERFDKGGNVGDIDGHKDGLPVPVEFEINSEGALELVGALDVGC